ncbi:MAG: hypothetical protein P4M15_10490 [Alphaproteobacteria bacterium]|nr:hypothetical protein [Alphaproteobacteria bacterium]
MQLRSFFLLSAGLLVLSYPAPAVSGEASSAAAKTPADLSSNADCGGADALTGAQRLLARNTPSADHAALLCLFDELRKMQADAPIKQRRDLKALNVPSTTQAPQ